MNWKKKVEPTISIDLWIAKPAMGFYQVQMIKAAQKYVNEVGLCVSFIDATYHYTNGTEPGFRVGIRNYPRFPENRKKLREHATKLGFLMAEAGNQDSFMVEEEGEYTHWYSRRGDIE